MNRTLLVWKYFFKQKWQEIYDYFWNWWDVYFVISIVIAAFFQIGWVSNSPQYYSEAPAEAIAPLLGKIGLYVLAFWALVLTIALIKVICEWMHDNWERANKKADEEIKKNKGDRRR